MFFTSCRYSKNVCVRDQFVYQSAKKPEHQAGDAADHPSRKRRVPRQQTASQPEKRTGDHPTDESFDSRSSSRYRTPHPSQSSPHQAEEIADHIPSIHFTPVRLTDPEVHLP